MTTETKLQRIAQLSKRDPQRSFINLMCTFNEESLKECFDKLNKKKAVGVDKVTKATTLDCKSRVCDFGMNA